MRGEETLVKKEVTFEEDVLEKSEMQQEASEITTSTTGLIVTSASTSTEDSKKLEKRVGDLQEQLNEKEKAILKFEQDQSELNEVIHKLKSDSGSKDVVSRNSWYFFK